MAGDEHDAELINLIRMARGLEAGGFYNASKYLWAMAYSKLVREGGGAALVEEKHDWAAELEQTVDRLAQAGADAKLIEALRAGVRGEIVIGDLPPECPVCHAHALTIRNIPPIYFMEYLSPEQAMDALRRMPTDLAGLIKDLSDEQLNQIGRAHV